MQVFSGIEVPACCFTIMSESVTLTLIGQSGSSLPVKPKPLQSKPTGRVGSTGMAFERQVVDRGITKSDAAELLARTEPIYSVAT